jgi:hypothetical protein
MARKKGLALRRSKAGRKGGRKSKGGGRPPKKK